MKQKIEKRPIRKKIVTNKDVVSETKVFTF